MKFKYWYVIIFLLLNVGTIAQISQENVKKIKDYVNYRITNDCINTLVNTSSGNKYLKDQKDIDACKKKYDIIKSNLLSKSFDDGLGYNNLSDLLKDKFGKVNSTLSSHINSLDFSSLITQPDEKVASEITAKALDIYKNEYENKFDVKTDTIQKNIEQDVLAFLKKNEQAVQPAQPKDSVVRSKPSTPNIQNDEEIKPAEVKAATGFFSFSNFNFWTLFLLLLLLILYLYCRNKFLIANERIKKRKKIEDVDDERDNSASKRNYSNQPIQTINKRDIEKYIGDSETIAELDKRIGKILSRLVVLEANNTTSLQTNISKTIDPPNPPINEEIFYMMRPVEGYFPDSNKSYSKNETVYKFTLKANKSEALFEIHTGGATVNDIARRNETYIKPACEEENIPGPNITNIITKRQGVAYLEGDKWIIRSKAVIRYE